MKVLFTDEERRGKVIGGVDTHTDAHWLCILDERGGVKLSKEFPATAAGYDDLARAIGPSDGCLAIGIEGTGSYGAGLARRLSELGYRVYEVLRPKREKRGIAEDKNDGADAERAARDVMAGHGLSEPKSQDGWVEGLRVLLNARDQAVKSCTSLSNAARSMLITADEQMRRAYEGMAADRLMKSLANVEGIGEIGCATAAALRGLASAWRAADEARHELEASMRALLEGNCPALIAMYCCGVSDAAALAVAAGDNPQRLRSEASFAALCGASPVEASSGKTKRHRLNRGGDRRANTALYMICIRRMGHDPKTRAYVARYGGYGGPGNNKEIERRLKRYIAREAYHAIMHPFDLRDFIDGRELAKVRKKAGLTQVEVAKALGVSSSSISDVENMHEPRRELAKKYAAWIEQGMPIDVT